MRYRPEEKRISYSSFRRIIFPSPTPPDGACRVIIVIITASGHCCLEKLTVRQLNYPLTRLAVNKQEINSLFHAIVLILSGLMVISGNGV